MNVVAVRDPLEIGPDRPDVAIIVFGQQQATGTSSPASGFDVMNWVPSGGLPNTSKVEGRSLMPASAASFDWSTREKLDPLGGNIRLDAADRLGHRNGALYSHNAVVDPDPGVNRGGRCPQHDQQEEGGQFEQTEDGRSGHGALLCGMRCLSARSPLAPEIENAGLLRTR